MPAQMARLNEPAPAPETMESLKRKFMRQNRDIARANSTQSLRIRNLENETSRLLAENLGLREEIIRLKNEMDNGKAQRIADNATVLRSQLEAKLLEIGELISGLGDHAPKKKSPQVGKIARASPARSPDQKNWKNMCTLSEAVGAQDGRLPPILENKTYPRRTLERQEILGLVADAEVDTTDSPEIGPPPVSQFVDEDPVKIDLPRRPKKEEVEEPAGLDPTLSINLEQRRKRKDSTILLDTKQSSQESLSDTKDAEVPVKIGAKRKLSVRDDEENERPRVPPSPDNFKFTRVKEEDKLKNKSSDQQERSSTKPSREIAVPRGAAREKQAATATTSTRKALAPKSVNDSPRKNAKASVPDLAKPAKPDFSKSKPAKGRPKEDRRETVQVQAPMNPVIKTVEVLPEPETPAGLDLFSPPTSQPSTARAESRDTPPPSDFGSGAEGPRPSRRARGAVSYAEPNLRDKMRRPTKDLVDAVTKEEKAQRTSMIKLEEGSAPSTTSIKAEPEADDAWKSMPAASSTTIENSPLSSKAPESLPSSITTHRKRRESMLNQSELELPRSSSGNAIAALLAETRKARAAAKEKSPADETTDLAKRMENLDIYEFKASPPVQTSAPEAKSKEDKPALRFSRRHPSISRDAILQDDSEASDMEGQKKTDNATSQRRQSTLGLRSSGTNPELSKGTDTQRSLTRSTSAAAMIEAGQGGSRNDRVSARRRSMML
ncbi:uncharacterized protein PAC_02925 [Phialocephala subalpina]|uniref:Shugoshin n=1 Tax=Phialocephala subalpina TaxID=576137 RepID=A0A1L7WJT9_9HELO|nr:uncharacterized protein PAC_02925 [Phialocephala subalpina]